MRRQQRPGQWDQRDHLRLARTEGWDPSPIAGCWPATARPKRHWRRCPDWRVPAARSAPAAMPAEAEIERELERLARLGGRLLILGQPEYPPLLALLDDAPPLLAMLGDPAALSAPGVALVGGRNASANGQRMAETLAAELAAARLTVISGLARGIDAAAHAGALRPGAPSRRSPAGSTRPTRPNTPICSGGSPKAARWSAKRRSAPYLKHAISPAATASSPASSLGVVVVEAALRSGSLITARLAQEAGRELFAVPGSPLDPRTQRLQRPDPPGGAPHRNRRRRARTTCPTIRSARGWREIRCSPAAPPTRPWRRSPSRRKPGRNRRRPGGGGPLAGGRSAWPLTDGG